MKCVNSAVFLAIFGVFSLYWGCEGPTKPDDKGKNGPGGWTPELPSCAGQTNDGLDVNSPDLGLKSAVVITYKDGAAAEIVKNTYGDSVSINTDGGHLVLSNAYILEDGLNVVLSGVTKNGSFKISPDFRIAYGVWLYLNDVDITNPDGSAINIQKGSNAGTISVKLVGGCGRQNRLNGKGLDSPATGEQAKGAFFSEAKVVFSGSGSLEVRSKQKHAIVVDNHFEMESGNIIIHEAAGDGIHINRVFSMTGGTLQIKSVGDAIQNERPYPINISGGKITLWTTGEKSHGVACDSGDVTVGGSADVKITVVGNGSKGIRSRGSVTISGGTTNIETYGNIAVANTSGTDDTTSAAAGVKAGADFIMSMGNLKIKSAGENSKGINVDRNADIIGGTVNIVSVGDGIKTDGNLTISGGSVYTKSTEKKGIDCKGTRNISVTIEERDGGGTGF